MSKPWLSPSSYSQWVSDALRLGSAAGNDVISLFDSSVPEPRAMLRDVIENATAPQLGGKFVSAFGGGNRFVIDFLAARYKVAHEQVLCTTGATASLSLIYRTFCAPGDHVLIERPGFDLFADLAVDLGVEWSGFTRSGDMFDIDVAQVESQIRPSTRLIVLSNLHNPSGMHVNHATLIELARLAERKGVILVVDEVYGDYAGADIRPGPACALSPSVISVSSLTKILGLGGLRCGWLVGAAPLVKQVRQQSMRVDFGVSSLSHAVAAYVVERYDEFEAYAMGVVQQARPIFVRWFETMSANGLIDGTVPAAGCIAFPRLTAISDADAFARSLLGSSGVMVAPGSYFGAADHIRIGFAHAPDVLERGLHLLGQGIRDFVADGGATNGAQTPPGGRVQ